MMIDVNCQAISLSMREIYVFIIATDTVTSVTKNLRLRWYADCNKAQRIVKIKYLQIFPKFYLDHHRQNTPNCIGEDQNHKI